MNVPKWQLWVGRILSALPVAMLGLAGVMKLSHAPQVVTGFSQFGYPESAILWIGLAELTCAVLYAIPRTAVFGAILMTGFLGGAVATHVRLGQHAFVGPVILGVVAWAGLYLREERLRALLPLRAPAP